MPKDQGDDRKAEEAAMGLGAEEVAGTTGRLVKCR